MTALAFDSFDGMDIDFDDYFGDNLSRLIPYQWMPKWVKETNDPSARVLEVYKNDEE